TVIDAFFAKLEGIAVVEVDGNGNIGRADGGFDEFFEVDGMRIFPGAAGDLQHHGRLFFFASLDDGLEKFHVIDVKSAERVFALEGFGKEVLGMCQWHSVPVQFNYKSIEDEFYETQRKEWKGKICYLNVTIRGVLS